MAKLYWRQDGQLYSIYTPNGILIAQIYMGNDGQYARDAQTLTAIGKLMAKRWGIETTKGK